MEIELYVVGIGPGGAEYMTQEAADVLGRCDVIAGYTLYVDLIKASFPGKKWITTGMRREKERCLKALGEASKGYRTAVVCSGDAGVYGMAGLMLELTRERPDVKVRVVAGVTACLSGAALLGAPVGHDFCVISLSDLMTPWEVIEKRIDAAARADFCIEIQGDSMEPYIQNGQRVYVKRGAPLKEFEPGIFFVDGDVFCKQFCPGYGGAIYLLSANPRREDANITISRESGRNCVYFGKVLLGQKLPKPQYQ